MKKEDLIHHHHHRVCRPNGNKVVSTPFAIQFFTVFIQAHHFSIIPDAVDSSLSWTTSLSCSRLPALSCPSHKLVFLHSFHVNILSQRTFSYLLSHSTITPLIVRRHLISASSSFFVCSSLTAFRLCNMNVGSPYSIAYRSFVHLCFQPRLQPFILCYPCIILPGMPCFL